MRKVLFFCFLSIFAAAGFSEDIKKVTAEGLTRYKQQEVLAGTTSITGTQYSIFSVKDDIAKIYSLGYFSDIHVLRKDMDGGIELIFRVIERPVVKEIKYTGIKELGLGDIESEFGIKQDAVFDQVKLKEGIQKIIEYYQDKNFNLAGVTYEIKEDKKANTVELTVNVKEGKRMYIAPSDEKGITFKGVKAFPERTLKGKMETAEAAFLVSGKYKEETLKSDLTKLVKYYWEEGFLTAKVLSYNIKYNDTKEKIYIEINIEEGLQYRLGEIKLEVNDPKIYSAKDIGLKFSGVSLKSFDESKPSICVMAAADNNQVFNYENFKRDLYKIKSLYDERGFISPEIKDERQLDNEKKLVSYVIRINEGSVSFVEKISIDGNYKTKDHVIRREILLKPGDQFDGDRLRTSFEKIYNLGFFDDVQVNTAPGSSDNKKELIFNIKERATGQLNLGAGYNSLDGLTGYLQVTENNLFGMGQRLSAMWEFGAVKQNYELSFLEPYFLNEPLSVGASIYKLLRAYYSDYKDERIGGNLRIGLPSGLFTKYWFTYQYEQVNIYDVADTASELIKNSKGINTTSSLTFNWIEDTRDSIFFNTKRGHKYSASIQYAGGLLLGDNNFTKYIVDTSWYYRLFGDFVLALHVSAGYATGFGNTVSVPFYERFFVGGTDSVRGYDERVLSPLDSNKNAIGGNFMLYGNVENRFPIAGPLYGTLFFDWGRSWDHPTDARLDQIPTSVGLGLRFVVTGAMMLRLDYGYGFDNSLASSGGKLHFNIGNIFQ
jgi:outer membrane protein insertion porin family